MERMDRDMPFLLQYEHVAWFEKGKVRILDRRVYPTEVRFVVCTDYHEVVQAIADMVTQSAGPYTAVGMGMALAAWQVRDKGAREQAEFLQQAACDLAHARPTTAGTARSPAAAPTWPRRPWPRAGTRWRPSWRPPWSP